MASIDPSSMQVLMKFEDNSVILYRKKDNGMVEVLYRIHNTNISGIYLKHHMFDLLKKNFFNNERKVNLSDMPAIYADAIADLDGNFLTMVKIQAEEYDNVFALYYINEGVKHYIFDQENYIKERIYN